MSTHPILFAFAFATALAVPTAARAEPNPDRAQCFLRDERILSVRPYYERSTLGTAIVHPLRGAEVQLAPMVDLSSERLQASLQQLLRSPRREPLLACLADVGHVHIESDPLGSASTVQLIARDPKDAEQVFRRAQRLVNE
jgi:hypothetical protein